MTAEGTGTVWMTYGELKRACSNRRLLRAVVKGARRLPASQVARQGLVPPMVAGSVGSTTLLYEVSAAKFPPGALRHVRGGKPKLPVAVGDERTGPPPPELTPESVRAAAAQFGPWDGGPPAASTPAAGARDATGSGAGAGAGAGRPAASPPPPQVHTGGDVMERGTQNKAAAPRGVPAEGMNKLTFGGKFKAARFVEENRAAWAAAGTTYKEAAETTSRAIDVYVSASTLASLAREAGLDWDTRQTRREKPGGGHKARLARLERLVTALCKAMGVDAEKLLAEKG